MDLPSRLEREVGAVATLFGRTMMVLGGAYLLRALTETGRLPGNRGVALGFAYALMWFGAADRAGGLHPLSGVFHGLAAVLIGLPLLWEASTRFGLFNPAISATALALMTLVALGVAWHRRLQSLAAAALVGALVASVFLIAHSGEPVPFTVTLLALGAVTLWLSDASRWSWVQWPIAIAVNLLLAGLIGRALTSPPLDPPAIVVALQIMTLVVYGGSVVTRTLVYQRQVRVHDVAHTALLLLVALGGALWVTNANFHGVHLLLGILAALGAAGSYVIAFERIGRRPEVAANFYFYLTIGLVLAFVGVRAIASGPPVALAFMLAALVTTWAASGIAEPALALHGAVFGLAAAIGLMRFSAQVWATNDHWRAAATADWILVAGLGALLLLPRSMSLSRRVTKAPQPSTIARVILACAFVTAAGGLLVWLLAPAIAGTPANDGILASLRTIVLAIAAVLVALLGCTGRFAEFGWLVYPILGLAGIKLLVDDLPHSTASTLFVALAVYGAALIAAPKIRRWALGTGP